MSKEEFMNVQTCVLKVNIHCYGCKQKVKKILQKIEGVLTTKIDADQGKVTVSGRVDPSVLIKKLAKSGKHAEILGAQKGNNNPNQSHLANQLKGGGLKNGGGNQQLNPKQIQNMKGFQELKLPQQLKNSVPENKNQNEKGVKFNVPEEEEDFSDDEYDDEFTDAGDDEFDDDEFDDLPSPSHKMKPNMMMPNNQQMMMMMNANLGGGPTTNGGKRASGGGPTNQQMTMNANLGGGPTKNGGKGASGGGKGEPNSSGGGGGKGDSGDNGNQNQGGGKNGGKNAGGDGKNGGEGGGPNAGKKVNGGGGGPIPASFLPMGGGAPPYPIGGPMGMIDPMGNIPAVQGLPPTGAPPGYFRGVGSDPIQMLQQQQQQEPYLAAVMNQQRAMGNERFQPMVYIRPPPPAFNYMPPHLHLHQCPNPYPCPYPYPPHGNDQYPHVFNDESTSSCYIM